MMKALPAPPCLDPACYLLMRQGCESPEKQAAFLLLYVITKQSLALGDTWLWFDDIQDEQGDTDQWGLSGNHWCIVLLRQALPLVDDSLGRVYGEFAAHCHIKQQDALSEIKKDSQKYPKEHDRALRFFIELLWQFYQFYHTKHLREWYHTLQESFFCGASAYFILGDFRAGDGFGMWLNWLWHAEHTIACRVNDLKDNTRHRALPLVFDQTLNEQQQKALNITQKQRFVIITGGPGTGKTHTVGRLVGQLLQQEPTLALALAAPTGKAANRMQQSLANALKASDIHLPVATTLHRLLGVTDGATPKYTAHNPLPYKLIVIDESSMIGVKMAAWLFDAIAHDCQLILLGDAGQLAAVEAGAVLADLCRLPVDDHHVNLTLSRRFDDQSVIGKMARLTQSSQSLNDKYQTLVQLLGGMRPARPSKRVYDQLIKPYEPYFTYCRHLYKKNSPIDESDLAELFQQVNRYRVLCAGHLGDFGDEQLNHVIALAHLNHQQPNKTHNKRVPLWYHGLLVMVTQNNYSLGLFNGDVGVCLYHQGKSWVFFEGRTAQQAIPTEQLSEAMVSRGYAITVHKSQGSEFDEVAICLEERHKQLISSELLYTAITRAKTHLNLYASKEAVLLALSQKSTRNTGLFYLMNNH